MPGPVDALCLRCGLCCNGVLFADVRPEPGDHSILFSTHGRRVAQPCPAFKSADCTCTIYAGRPTRCRQFECKQLLAVRAGDKSVEAALFRIREARRLVKEIERMLAALGFEEKDLPLRKRFQRCQKSAEQGKIRRDDLGRLAELQLAVHRLNALLAEHFYA